MLLLSLPWFDGTLDALLAMVERSELDIASLALSEVVEHCLASVAQAETRDADTLAGLVSAVSRLMLLKSAALLPRPVASETAQPADEAIGTGLEECLRQYRLFKLAAAEFRDREDEGLRSYPRIAPMPAPATAAPLPGGVSLDRLLAVVQDVLRRRPPDPPQLALRRTVTVAQRLAELEAALEHTGEVSFTSFIAGASTRVDVIVGFMAVLELIKRGRAAAEQREPFGDILIVARAPVAVAAD